MKSCISMILSVPVAIHCMASAAPGQKLSRASVAGTTSGQRQASGIQRGVVNLGAAASGGFAPIPYFVSAGPDGILVYVPGFVMEGAFSGGPGRLTPRAGPALPPTEEPKPMQRLPVLEMPPRFSSSEVPRPQANVEAIEKNRERATHLVVVGDRFFRANNLKHAEDRYGRAAKLAPDSAEPWVRLAQLSFVRSRYREAAHRLRQAETAQPGWIRTAPDIQAIYGEPTEFANHLARLESHLHAHPQDHDAWLVLGAQWYLSGRTDRAIDVFQRLQDPRRKPDVALAAFLEATSGEHTQQ